MRKYLLFSITLFLSSIFFTTKAMADNVITHTALLQASRTSLWQALSALAPSLQLSDHAMQGDANGYTPATSAIHGYSRWDYGSARNILVVVDGERVPVNTVRTMSIYDVDSVRILTDATSLSRWGLNGGDGVIEIATSHPQKGNLKVRYNLDATIESAIKGVYDHSRASKDGYDWLSEPLRTGFHQSHKLDVEGSDGQVGYKFSARLAPAGRGVMKGSNDNLLSLRSYVEYNQRALHLHNDILFDHYKTDASNYRHFGDLALIPDSESPYDANGQLREFITIGGKQVPSPAYEHSLGSYNREKTATITDRFGARLDIGSGLTLNGHFSFVRQILRNDNYLSPSSAYFIGNKDVRLNGTYYIARNNITTLEGDVSLDYDKTFGKNRISANIGASAYRGKTTYENYGGRGILSDMMNYISFTQSYDTLQHPTALRLYENTYSLLASASYLYDNRYGIAAGINGTTSNTINDDHDKAAYFSTRLFWNAHNESWLKGGNISLLTISLSAGTTGIVPFSDRDFLASYDNDYGNEYIYNYYQIGARLRSMPNADLRPTKVTMFNLAADMRVRKLSLHAEAYHNITTRMLIISPLPLASGFDDTKDNGGRLTNSGFDLSLSSPIASKGDFTFDGALAMNFNHNSVTDIPDYFNEKVYSAYPSAGWQLSGNTFRASLQALAAWRQWSLAVTATAKVGGSITDYLASDYREQEDNRLSLSAVQLGYNVPLHSNTVKSITLALTGNNLALWRSAKVAEGIYYPLTRSCTLSAAITF